MINASHGRDCANNMRPQKDLDEKMQSGKPVGAWKAAIIPAA
jgi:hypothetical protein